MNGFLPSLVVSLVAGAPAAQTRLQDQWSERVVMRAEGGTFAAPIHATLMPDGRIVMMGFVRDTEDPEDLSYQHPAAWSLLPTPAFTPLARQQAVALIDEPLDKVNSIEGTDLLNDDLFCSGHTLTADGELMTVGGTRTITDLLMDEDLIVGMPYATRYDGKSWLREPADTLVVGGWGEPARWYPAVTRLPDERILVTGGWEIVEPLNTTNLSVEAWTPATGSWDVLADFDQAPLEIFNIDYTQPVVLPSPVGTADLLMFGQWGCPILMELGKPPVWTISSQLRPGTQPGEKPNSGTSSALLPLRLVDGEWGYANGSMLLFGGQLQTDHMQALDVYDPLADQWWPRFDTGIYRHHPTLVLLPNGDALVVNGHAYPGQCLLDECLCTKELLQGYYVSLRNGLSGTLGASISAEVRGYHSVALLLPDGRVFCAGGRDNDTGATAEKSNFRYLYPPYMFEARPKIVSSATELGYGKSFVVRTQGPAVTEFALVALGSITHSFDFNQRHIQLAVESAAPGLAGPRVLVPPPPPAPLPLGNLQGSPQTLHRVSTPSDSRVAPPGHYMLFAITADGVPSEARIVSLR